MRLNAGLLVAALGFLIALALPSTDQHAAAETAGQIEGSIPASGGFAIVVWTGGGPESLIGAAAARGCPAAAAWIAVDGALVGYIHGAPEFVNAEFRGRFPDSPTSRGTALVLVCPAAGTGSAVPTLLGPPRPESSSVSPPAPMSLEQQFGAAAFNGINAARQQAGLVPLNFNPELRRAAEKYAQLLVDAGQMSHSMDGLPWDRAQREGYPSGLVGEIIAWTSTSEALDVERETTALMKLWLNSPPHYEIIVGAFIDLGVGCALGKDSGGLDLVMCVGMTGIP
jgi:uncharacterized protein YkwD